MEKQDMRHSRWKQYGLRRKAMISRVLLFVLWLLLGYSLAFTPVFNHPIVLAQTAAPEDRLAEAERLNQQVLQLYEQGKYAEAIPLAEQALQIREQILGANHPDVATSLNDLAVLYQAQGRYSEAEPLHKQALSIREQQLGADHPSVAASLNNLAFLYQDQGRYSEAEPLFKQSLSIREQQLGVDHPDVATSLNNLALLYQDQGRYSEAEPLHKQALSIREQQLGADHPDVATSLNNLAALYSDQGRYSEAEPLYEQSLSIWEEQLGADHPDVATSLNNLAALYQDQGRYSEAEPLHKQSLSIFEQQLGVDHPDVATSLISLAELYRAQGRYSEAEPLFKQSLSIFEQQLGVDQADVATSLNYLALLYQDQGRYSEAEPLFKQSLSIREQQLGADHPDVANSLNNLATLYRAQGRYSEAEPLYKQALSIREQQLGVDHPDVANSLISLAVFYWAQGRYSEAEPLYEQSLSVFEQQLGTDHPNVAASLISLAVFYQDQGRYSEAEPLFKQSLSIFEQQLGVDHPDVATSLISLAVFYWAEGKLTDAVDFFDRGLQVEETNLALNLASGSEARKQAYLNTLAGATDVTISLHLQSAANNPEAAKLALTTVLRRKGRILEAVATGIQRLRQNLSPQDQQTFDQLQTARTQLANLTYGGLGNLTPEQYRAQLDAATAQAEQLANALAERSAEFRVEAQPVEIAAVQQNIPADAALIELVRYRPFDPKASAGEKYGAPHYAAYVLHSTGDPKWVDLGEAAPIDQAVQRYQAVLQQGSSSIDRVQQFGRELDQRVMQPIRPLLDNRTHVLLSPDSQLNLIPFAALVDQNNQYLIEKYTFTYLTSGRDLLKIGINDSDRQPRQAPVLLANPDYENPGDPDGVQVAVKGDGGDGGDGEQGRAATQRSVDLASLKFGALAGTQQEADAIRPLLTNPTILTGQQATENALKQLQAPSILHIATHGFFLSDVDCTPAADVRGSVMAVPLENRQPECRPTPQNSENPLLRSGLALAGFNPRQSGSEDGVLTALEAAGLDLYGTQIVVLSACETGLGDVANGEGVYGLRRAFVMAGTESQLMSLWKVDDYGTSELMSTYYQRIQNGESRSEAFRQVQLEFLQAPAYQHPYYWAAFIFSGDWREMN